MKGIILVLGAIFCLAALSRMSLYIMDYIQLSEYGKGFIWGNILLFLFGLGLIIWSRRGKKA